MSYILEALRKAQQEQQRGQAPDLKAAVGIPAPQPRRRRRRWGLAAAALVLGTNALVLGWALRDRPPGPLPAPIPASRPPGAQAAPPEARLASAFPGPAEAPRTGERRRPAEARPLASEAERRTPAPPPGPAPALEPQRSFVGAADPAASRPPSPAAPAAPLPTDEPAVPEPPVADGSAAVVAQTPPVLEPRREAAAVARTPPVPIHELPPEVRQGLPPLEINGHVYSDDPSDRFVFINWKPYREGDRLGVAEAPVLERIIPEGVVVDFGSVRALVPVLP